MSPTPDTVHSFRSTTVSSNGHSVENRTECAASDDFLDSSKGRWVRFPFPDAFSCPVPMKTDEEWSLHNNIMKHDPERPHCWHRDDLNKYGNLIKSKEIDGLWNSYLRSENEWYGAWRQHDCDCKEYTDADLQLCVDRLGMKEVQVVGTSVAMFLEYYLKQRLANISFPQGGGRTTILDTLQFPHKLWQYALEDWRYEMTTRPNSTDAETRFLVSGFYFSSECEAHVLAPRSKQFTKIAEEMLTPKGYVMLNAYEITSGFTFDTAGQSDGLHIMGPPAKTLVVKFFHHLCSD